MPPSSITDSLFAHCRSEALALIKQYNLFKRGVEELHCLEVCYGYTQHARGHIKILTY